jgi:superfamily II DNA helicase RecQ
LSSDPNTSVEEGQSVCFVVVPLITLMDGRVVSLTSQGLSVGSDCSPEHLSEIKEGKVKLVFGTPEALLNSHRGIFRGPLKMNLKAVFIDESHCIAKW